MDNKTKKTIGQRINAALAKRDMKQKELAAAIGVKDNVISYFTSGTRIPNTEQIIEIARVLNVSTDFLLGLLSEPTADNELALACDYTGLPEDAVDCLNQMKNDQKHPYMHDLIAFVVEEFLYGVMGFSHPFEVYMELLRKTEDAKTDIQREFGNTYSLDDKEGAVKKARSILEHPRGKDLLLFDENKNFELYKMVERFKKGLETLGNSLYKKEVAKNGKHKKD